MKTLDATDLCLVSGGSASKNDQVSTALTQIQSSIKDVAANQNTSGGSSSTTMMMMAMMMSQRSGPTVIAAPAASGPVVNISTRVRRGW